ncbi:copper homeostasis protein CutC [Sphingobacterium lactis]|uniref:copper homeostasis protein CutC n=1 Tax=Sphingobacterium lactis TaxID=797291 RepID=UPI003F7E5E02
MEKEINGIKLEICANSIYSAEQAQAAGASRVELCQNLENGGTTPSYGQIKTTRDLLHIGVHVLIRPRAGDFLYNKQEFEEMKADIKMCKELKCDGVVIGILDEAGHVDIPRMNELVNLAKPMTAVFHRAFDRCADPYQALEDIISLGCDRILTSGQKNTAEEGRVLLQELVELAGGRIEIMPGSGVHAQNVKDILNFTQARSIHASAKTSIASEMLYHNDNLKGMDEDVIFSDRKKVEELIEQIKSL